MKPKIYIDGQAGTTGLEILSRLESRDDLELLKIEEEKRHDPAARKALMEQADLVFLCLPDEAAREAVAMMEGMDTKIIDASTAHRTQWTYGFAELLPGQEEKIIQADKVANPGCHASGFLALAAPLIHGGLLPDDVRLTCFSLTGYTGGGKRMIQEYENPQRDPVLDAPRLYGLNLQHKHLPEMQKLAGLKQAPVFVPIVDDYPRGMSVSIPLPVSLLRKHHDADSLRHFYAGWYQNQPLIEVVPEEETGMLAANALAGKDTMRISVSGNADQLLLNALFDNLGKGASGAAIENMNLMLGLDKTAGLHL